MNELMNVFKFMNNMYERGNPYISTMFDNEVMLELIGVKGAEDQTLKFKGGDMQKQFSMFFKRKTIHKELWK